jgi:hypothetical protein
MSKTSEVDTLTAVLGELIEEVLGRINPSKARARAAIGILTKVMSIAGYTVQQGMIADGFDPGTQLECAQRAVKYVIDRLQESGTTGQELH